MHDFAKKGNFMEIDTKIWLPEYVGSLQLPFDDAYAWILHLETKPSKWRLFWFKFFFGATWKDN